MIAECSSDMLEEEDDDENAIKYVLCASCGVMIYQEEACESQRRTLLSLDEIQQLFKFVFYMLGSCVVLVNLVPKLMTVAIMQAGCVGYLVVLFGIIGLSVWAFNTGGLRGVVRWTLGMES